MKLDEVYALNSTLLFQGTPEETRNWLVGVPSNDPRWVVVGETQDLISASQYLDLGE